MCHSRRASQPTIRKAISQAKETDNQLYFLYVVNLGFLERTVSLTMTSIRMVYQELHETGVFAMLILCDRATRRGVTKVDYLVREGDTRMNFRDLAVETHAEIIMMGYPTRSPGANVFKLGG